MVEITQETVAAWLAGTLQATSELTYQETAVAANTGANFLGTDNSDPGAQGEAIFSDPRNLPTAVATILNHAQNRANFHPASQTPEEVAKTYKEYIRQIDIVPLMSLQKNDRIKQNYSSSDYNVLINNIVSLYDSVSQQDRDKIKNNIANLAKSVFSQTRSEIWTNLFSQATLNYTGPNEMTLYIYYTTLYMKHEDKGKSGVSDYQEYTVNRSEYKVLPDLIRNYAQQLARLSKKNVDDWMDDSTSPEKPNYKLCFDVDPYTEPAAL